MTSYPRDLRQMTPEQRQETLDFFKGLGLPELRRRQQLTEAQMKMAYDKKIERALINLTVQLELLDEAVSSKLD